MIDDIAADAAGFLVRQVGGLAVDLTVDQIFSRHSARSSTAWGAASSPL